MTRSARRSNAANAAVHHVAISNERCIECKAPLVHTQGIKYICTRCGLVQEIETKDKEF
ncbi:MAG TPA: hypothetical protein VKM55_21635 [Candidatus Lokiarchaeia archaeon]|nr:hypothetical protein [Candidatus Lokiarchaeia archaeon]